MNTTDLLLQMTLAATQIAQNTEELVTAARARTAV